MSRAKAYYELTKPGVTYGNAISAVAGFLFASHGMVDWAMFFWITLGTTLVIGSACALNNYLDQDIDAKMERTQKRAKLIQTVGSRNALLFAIAIGFIGFAVLAAFTNWWVVLVEVIGYFDYVVLYGMWSKRKSVHGTLVGSISGAAPILAGYAGAAGGIDLGGWLVFAVIFVWQMPEFYSISIYRRKEYAAAGLPVSGVVRGVKRTTQQIFVYTFLFVLFSVGLWSFDYADSITYIAAMGVAGLYWLWLGWQGMSAKDPDAWARRMFKFSLTALLLFCGLISIDAWLP
ncbi:MAG TPA: heme o synthase [Candidatus Saccharimonadales bacterium]|nr:heme o synthase [Candidatus Saccharimonadales bacterium]